MERFLKITAPNLDELLVQMNTTVHPYARVIQVGIDVNGEWLALVDMALPLVLTIDDVEGTVELVQNNEIDDTLEDEEQETKVTLTA